MRVSILVVEPDPVALDALTAILERLGHLVFAVPTGQLAKDVMEQVCCDILVTSLVLESNINGMSLAILAKEMYRHLDVIVTKRHSYSDVSLSFVDAYLRKPFVADEVQLSISTALNRIVARRNNVEHLISVQKMP